jgi:hypothetical protein
MSDTEKSCTNPLLDAFHQAQRSGDAGWALGKRHDLCDQYSWAIPTPQALDFIHKHAPGGIIEVGAGRGYWASLLQKAHGADSIIATDRMPPTMAGVNSYHPSQPETWREDLEPFRPRRTCLQAKGTFTEVAMMKANDAAGLYPGRALMLCWPPYDTPMAAEALATYAGNTVIYIGEGYGGCTGNDKFHQLLEEQWEAVDNYHIPQWIGIHDYVCIYRRQQPM